MRIFNDAMTMVREVERDLFEMGIRVHPDTMQDIQVKGNPDYDTVELQAYGYMLTKLDPESMWRMVGYMKGSDAWVDEEAKARVSNEYLNPGEAWRLDHTRWERFIRDGQFAYTYNERFREQLPQVIRELLLRPNTRQAVMTMYDRHQDMNNWGGKDRIPCSMYYQFFIRGGKLNLIYTMRSCDFLTHFAHDVALAILLLRHVAVEINMSMGTLTHFMGSLHAYEKDMRDRGIF